MIAIIVVIILSPFVLLLWFSTTDFNMLSEQDASVAESGNSYYYEASAENNDKHKPFQVLSDVASQVGGDIKEAANTIVKEFGTVSSEYEEQVAEYKEESFEDTEDQEE